MEHFCEIEGVRMSYGEVQVIWDVCLRIGAKETVSLVGLNGVGK